MNEGHQSNIILTIIIKTWTTMDDTMEILLRLFSLLISLFDSAFLDACNRSIDT